MYNYDHPDPCGGQCENGATCKRASHCDYICICRPGFTGNNCQDDDQSDLFCREDSCFNGGTCTKEFGNETSCQCVCGYGGEQCTEDDPVELFCNSDTCMNGGTCVDIAGPYTQCVCVRGFTGQHCSMDDPTTTFCNESLNFCENGGTCNELYGTDTNCSCASGYTGDHCTEDDPTELFCSEVSCMNDGTCTEVYGPNTNCECVSGFMGLFCSEDDPAITFCDEPSNFCENGGTCNELYGTETNCSCASGYTGDYCTEDNPTDSFCSENTCQYGGTCQEAFGDSVSCICAIRFVGARCEWLACPSNGETICENGGTCYQVEENCPTLCACLPQFTGSRCETRVCEAEEDVPVYPGSSVRYSWPATEAGSRGTAACPDICQEVIDTPSGAVVERVCGRDSGQWLETNITPCGLTLTALQLCESIQLPAPIDVASTVLDITSNPSGLDSSAFTVISGILTDLTDDALEEEKVYDTYLNIVDNVLEGRKDQLLMSQTKSNSSSRILEEITRLHNEIPLGEQTHIVKKTMRNYGMIILDLTDEDGKYDSFSADLGPINAAVLSNEQISPEQLIVDSGVLSNVTGSLGLNGLGECAQSRDRLRIVYSVFRTDALFLTPETACDLYAISSIIVGVGVNASNCATKLSVDIDLELLTEVCTEILLMNSSFTNSEKSAYKSHPAKDKEEQVCSNYKTEGAGRWSSENCKTITSSGGRTKCDCSQLGHFGLFFDLNPGEPYSPLALATISYAGATVSVFCLLLLLLTYLSSKTLRGKEHGRILIHISVSLVCLYVVWVVAGLVTSVQPLCGLVAALFQYILLVFFGWTAAEAVFLYHKLVIVLGTTIDHYVLKAGAIIWLAPLAITAISVGLSYQYYINPYYCRATEWPFWLGHILPVSLICVFNWIIFAIIMVRLCIGTVKVDVERHSARRTFKKNFFISVGLSLLLGLGWGFGLTATSSDLKELTFALQVIFSLFVGSQGVLIFVFHGLRSPQFRLVWTSAFGLRSKPHRKELSKKQSGSGAVAATGTYSSEPLRHPWASGNRAISSTDIDFEQQWVTQMSSFEPLGDTITESGKEEEECSST